MLRISIIGTISGTFLSTTWTTNTAIQRLVQQNSDQEHSLSRAQLIEMLDAAIAKQ